MLLKSGETKILSICVRDSNGNDINNSNPIVEVRNISNGSYWNGAIFDINKCTLPALPTSKGIYVYKFDIKDEGTYEVTMTDKSYNVCVQEVIKVYKDEAPVLKIKLNSFETFTVGSKDSAISKYTIKRILDEQGNVKNDYFNGQEYVLTEVELNADKIEATTDMVVFQAKQLGTYDLTIKSPNGSIESLALKVVNEITDRAPVMIDSKTLRSMDGTDSTVIDKNGIPLSGVKVVCYNKDTKEEEANVLTDTNGYWSMFLKPGTYIFTFAKDEYIGVSFEREVK